MTERRRSNWRESFGLPTVLPNMKTMGPVSILVVPGQDEAPCSEDSPSGCSHTPPWKFLPTVHRTLVLFLYIYHFCILFIVMKCHKLVPDFICGKNGSPVLFSHLTVPSDRLTWKSFIWLPIFFSSCLSISSTVFFSACACYLPAAVLIAVIYCDITQTLWLVTCKRQLHHAKSQRLIKLVLIVSILQISHSQQV